MSIIGIDLGCYSTYIAGIKDGTVEVLANEYSLLATPTAVSFNAVPRPMGIDSKQLIVSKFKNTVAYFKPLLRRDAEHGDILDAIPCKHFAVTPLTKDLYASVEVYDHENKPVKMQIQQVLAAYLTKLFAIASKATGVPVEECFLTVPYYYTAADRQVVLEAAKIAGFPFVKLINETAALAASYAFFKKASLPASNEPAKKVVFVDVGYSQAQISLAEVHKDGARVTLATHSSEIGGFFFDDVIRKYYAGIFKNDKKLDVSTNRKAWIKLGEETEKAKKTTSAGSTKVVSQIECLMEDTDFKAEIDRVQFEELAADILNKFEKLIIAFLHEAQINPANVEVELVGGSTRIPAVRAIVERNFQQTAKTTMNQDEAVVRGAALMAGLLSPRVRASQFKLQDFVPESVIARYRNEAGEVKYATIYKRGDAIPSKRHATFPVTEIDLYYAHFGNCNRQDLLHISHVALNGKNEPNPNAIEAPRYRFTFSYEIDHLIYCNTITKIEKVLPPPEPEKTAEPAAEKKDEKDAEPAAAEPAPPAAEPTPAAPAGPPQPKDHETRMPALSSLSSGVDQVVKQLYIDAEQNMRESDNAAIKKAEAKNSLESNFYEIRDKLEVNPGLFHADKREGFQKFMNDVEEFLYDDDAEFSVEDYFKKHDSLQEAYGNAVIHQVKVEEPAENGESMDVDPKSEEPPQVETK